MNRRLRWIRASLKENALTDASTLDLIVYDGSTSMLTYYFTNTISFELHLN